MEEEIVSLPDCDELFERFFKPWHEPESLTRRGFHGTRPDAESWCAAAVSAADASPLTEEGQTQIAEQVKTMAEAAAADWPQFLPIHGQPDLEWIDHFDRHFDRPAVAALINASDPSDFSNQYLVTCCEFGATLGLIMRALCPSLEWLYDWPYWESGLLDPATGYRINVFHWAIKKLSDYGVDDGYRAKVLACLNLIEKGWSD